MQNKNAVSLLDSALDCWPYNGANQCDKVLAGYFIRVIMSPKITQGCASAVCLYPISHEFICWSQGPRIKEHIWRCTSCGAPLAGGLAFLLSHKLLCSCCWAVAHGGTGANTHSQPVLQELALPSRTWDRFRTSQAVGKLKRITYKLITQLKTLTHDTGEVQMKKSLTPWMLQPAALPVLAPGLWHFPLLFSFRGLCAWQCAMSTNSPSANRAAMICPTKYLGLF